MKIIARTVYTIKLPSPSPGGKLPLSILDKPEGQRVYTKALLLFPSPNSPQLSTHNLKASLSKTLSLYYPLAGRFIVLPNGDLQVDCSDQGIEFVEAFVDGKLDDFGSSLQQQQHDPRFDILSPLPSLFTTGDMNGVPLAAAQVTRFQCGGSSLVLAVHHNFGDGQSFCSVLTAWSLVSQGREDDVAAPCFDRSLIPEHKNEADPVEEQVVKEQGIKEQVVEEQATKEQVVEEQVATAPKDQTRMFTFTGKDIAALKSSCGRPATKFEVVAAYLWKSITRARNLDPGDGTKMSITVDGRKRFVPPLPESYCGNLIFLAIPTSPVRELVDGPLSYAVSVVHESVHAITDEHMRFTLERPERQPNLPAIMDAAKDVMLSSWARFPLYEADFGSGNKPVFVGIPVKTYPPGVVLILPAPESDAVVAFVSLSAEHMRSLVEDQDFILRK